ncbi:MAG TPA: NUDIX hydrolase [Chitinophagaceae bacterium]
MPYTNPWKTLSSAVKYDNPWIRLTEHQVLNPRGGEGIYGVVHFKNFAIGIAALDEEKNIYLIGQYRFPLNGFSWEIPEGGGPLEENDPLKSAKRELLEETGLLAESWRVILRMHLSNSVSDELGILYLATGLTQREAQPEDTEELYLKKMPFAAAVEMVENGDITDSLSVAAILKIQLMLLKGEY